MTESMLLWIVTNLILCQVSSNYVTAEPIVTTIGQSEQPYNSEFGRGLKLVPVDDGGAVQQSKEVAKRSIGSVVPLSTGKEMGTELGTCQQDFVQPVADFVLRIVRSQLVKRGKQQIKIPDIHKTKFKSASPLGLSVHFDATEGWLRDLSSLRRVGKVNISRSGKNIIMEFGAGLKTMEFGYDKYVLRVGALSANGHINGEVANSSVTVKFSMDVGGQTCSLSLLDMKIGLLGDLKLRATGMGLLNVLYSHIVTSVTNNYREEALPKAEHTLRRNIQELFEKLRCDDDYEVF